MALEAAFQQLCAELRVLHEACTNLRTTVREDKPLQDDVVLVDIWGDAADDLIGALEEALAAASDGQYAAGHLHDLPRASRALLACEECCQNVARRYWSDLTRYERIRELRRLGRRRGGEWRAWGLGVKAALDACEHPLWTLDTSFSRCWQELVEHVGGVGLSVQNTNIGYRTTLAGLDLAR